ncbi:B-(1-6) glucan synthase [Coprinopsis sp. MPI-PUGE-AT-0042]|nr:B-(1-6) glucan synthase [Coprinopsis sp. MPI-PUGE-AT-0042]
MRSLFTAAALALCSFASLVSALPASNTTREAVDVARANPPPNCFPAVGFKMPSSVPSSLDNWWCDKNTEYAFVGVSYEITQCQSLDTLKREFKDIRTRFNGRYVRIYGACDQSGYYNNVIEAAWYANVGVHALIWFGFDGSTIYKTRREALFSILQSNPKAKYVVRVVQYGSEPLFDWAIGPYDLAGDVWESKQRLANLQIPVTVSEMAWGYQSRQNDGSMEVLRAIDFVDVHTLPFFSQEASTAWASWPIVMKDLNWFFSNSGGKKIYLSQPNSPYAVASVQMEQVSCSRPTSRLAIHQDYFDLLDSKCTEFKNMPGGGVGWFAHIYSDYQEPGYGLYKTDGNMKIRFAPKTSC